MTSSPRTGSRVRAPLVDTGLAAVTVLGTLVGVAAAGDRLNVEGTFPLAVFLGLALFARRRWPILVLLLSVQSVIGYRTAGLVDALWVWPATVAYFTVAVLDRDPAADPFAKPGPGRRWARGYLRFGRSWAGPARTGLPWAVGTGLLELGFATTWERYVVGSEPRQVLLDVGVAGLWLALVLACAVAYRNLRRWRVEQAARLRHLRHERDLEARRQAAEERLRIAQDLHDVLAHTLTVVGVQLRVAAEALDDSPAEAREALSVAQEVRSAAVTDLRSLLRVLRTPGDAGPMAPDPDLTRLDDLVARARTGGLAVTLDVAGDPANLPSLVSLAGYRVVQEALTNVVRHSGAGQATVRLRCGTDRLDVEVLDDGTDSPASEDGAISPASDGGTGTARPGQLPVGMPGQAPVGMPGQVPASTPGHGLAGMRERVTALGGRLVAGPVDGGGYRVAATVPFDRVSVPFEQPSADRAPMPFERPSADRTPVPSDREAR